MFFLAFLAALGPLSNDMYLPALPQLVDFWGVSEASGGLTLSLWFVSFGIFLLVYGPFSDRFGRKPCLMAGLGVFTLSSLGCALSNGLHEMLICRLFQAAGGAACASMVMAISRDVFDGHIRQRVLAYLGVIMAVAPMAAPFLGSFTLKYLSWRWIFGVQTLYGIFALMSVFFLEEPLQRAKRLTSMAFIKPYLQTLANGRFLYTAVLMALVMGPVYGFIAASPYIYMEQFGLDRPAFSRYFALNAVGLMLGSLFCAKLSKRFSGAALNGWGFAGVTLGGAIIVALSVFGDFGPTGFALPMMLIAFSCGASRPVSNNIVLDQVEVNVGAAASIMTFSLFMLGAVFMWVASGDFMNRVTLIGLMALGAGGFVLALWPLLLRYLGRFGYKAS